MTLVIAQTLRYGVGEGLKVAIAPLLTDLPIVLVSWLVAGFLTQDRLLGAVSVVGAIVLLYLAFDLLSADPPEVSAEPGEARSVVRGMLANFFNPHPWLFWLTLGASSLARGQELGAVAVAGFLVGLYAGLVGAKILVAFASARGRSWVTGSAYRWVDEIPRARALCLCGHPRTRSLPPFGPNRLGGLTQIGASHRKRLHPDRAPAERARRTRRYR